MDTPKRPIILYLVTKSNFGGAQRYVYDLATNPPPDYRVVVAMGGTGEKNAPRGKLFTRLKEAGVETVFLPNFMRNFSPFADFYATLDTWRVIKKYRPTILHVNSSKAGGIGALVGRILKVPKIVFTSHGLTYDENWRSPIARVVIKFFTWLTIMLADASIMISAETAGRARALAKARRKIHLVHNGIMPPTFLSRADARPLIHPKFKSAPNDAIWIGSIAEYHRNKNLNLLIAAIAKLKTHHSIQALLLGEGEERDHLSKLVDLYDLKNEVHLIGYIPEAARYLKAFDIFVLPSKKEGLPYVIMEAGYAGLSVVASDIPGHHDLIKSNETGLLTQPNSDDLADQLKKLILDRHLRNQLGEALQRKIQSDFSLTKMLTETHHLYTSLDTSNSSLVNR